MSGKPKYDQLIELLDTLVDWQKFGAFLPGIEREDIEVIEHESSSVDQQKAALFAKWLRLHPEASWDDVLSALAKSREYTLASNVYQNLNEVTTSRIDVQLQDDDKILVEKEEEIQQLTRKKSTIDKALVEKQEEINQVNREKEAIDKVLVEKQEEINQVNREKEAIDKILAEKQEEINQLTRQKEDNDKELAEKKRVMQQLARQKEGVKWHNDSIALVAPSTADCEAIMKELKQQKQQQPDKHWWIYLKSSPPDSLFKIFHNLNNCLVKGLSITDSPFDTNSASELSQALSSNKTIQLLQLSSSPFLPNGLEMLSKSVSTNTTLKRLWLWDINSISDEDAPSIIEIISNNKSLEVLHLHCPNITPFRREHISEALAKNNTMTDVLINGHFLRGK